MDNGGGNDGGSFKVKHGSNAADVTDVHEAGAGEVGDVVGEREMRIESNTKITDRGIHSFIHSFITEICIAPLPGYYTQKRSQPRPVQKGRS